MGQTPRQHHQPRPDRIPVHPHPALQPGAVGRVARRLGPRVPVGRRPVGREPRSAGKSGSPPASPSGNCGPDSRYSSTPSTRRGPPRSSGPGPRIVATGCRLPDARADDDGDDAFDEDYPQRLRRRRRRPGRRGLRPDRRPDVHLHHARRPPLGPGALSRPPALGLTVVQRAATWYREGYENIVALDFEITNTGFKTLRGRLPGVLRGLRHPAARARQLASPTIWPASGAAPSGAATASSTGWKWPGCGTATLTTPCRAGSAWSCWTTTRTSAH